MKKFTFNKLVVELTRKCNMNPVCPHCMRGNPQDITIKKEYIDTLLKQTVSIGELTVTGGEPTLCLDELEFIISKLYEYKIALFAFEVTSNGLIYDDRFVDIIKRYSELVTICRQIDFPNAAFPPFMEVNVQISLDKYHSHKELAKANFDKYKAAFKRIAQTTICTNGDFTKKCGNAETNNLRAYKPFFHSPDDLNNYRIGMVDETYRDCDGFAAFKLSYPEQVLICCPIELKCDGNLIRAEIADLDYKTMDAPQYQICNVNENIYENILKYNKGRMSCRAWHKKSDDTELLKVLTHLDDYIVAKELLEEREKNRTLETYVFSNNSL